jgi:hypothetical protein
MGAEEGGVQPDAANPLGDEPRVLPRRHAPSLTASADKQGFARFLASNSYVVIDRLSGLLGQFKPDGLPGLLLPHRRPTTEYPLGATSSTLRAMTSQPRSLLSMARLNIAKSRVRLSTWSLVRMDQTCFGRSGGFAPVSLPLFQGRRLDVVGTAFSVSCMVILLSY